jgi:hypothetical protein
MCPVTRNSYRRVWVAALMISCTPPKKFPGNIADDGNARLLQLIAPIGKRARDNTQIEFAVISNGARALNAQNRRANRQRYRS